MIVDFEYAGERLSEHGLIIASLDGSTKSDALEWGSQLEFNTIQNKISGISYATSSGYSDVYTVTFQVMKYSCRSGQVESISDAECRYLTKWLNRKTYQRFSPISDNHEFCGYHFYGSFNVNPVVIADSIVGLELTFTSNAPYGFGDTVSLDINSDSSGIISNGFYVYCMSDEEGFCPMKISIKTSSAGTISFRNELTLETTIIKNCKKDETITIDSEHLIITSDQTHPTLYNDFNYVYPRLLNKYNDSKNHFTMGSTYKVHIEYTPIRKIGAVL